MLIRYDKTADAKYITLLPKKQKKGIVARTKKVYPWLLVDYDASENIFGVEILNASQHDGTLVVFENQAFFLEGSPIPQKLKTGNSSTDKSAQEDRLTLSLDSYSLVNA